MIEIKMVGFGGQGCVTLSKLIAKAAVIDGKFAQAFPRFGAERRGMPVEAYCRIDKEEILLRMPVEKADYILVLDSDLIDDSLISSAKKNCLFIVNGKRPPEDLGIDKFKSIVVDLNSMAKEIFRRKIVNTCMFGAFVGATNVIKFQSAIEAVRATFHGKIAELNEEACMKAYELIRKNLLVGKYFLG
ncbi:hypothetical protein DRN63_00890 [Nanoarchaeota archaeon]|nr:MAG: hypothetical protein DRN63_00890 [Nanoarchaeota archaeon]